MSSKNGIGFSLKNMAESTPPVDPAEALRRQLSLAVFNSVKEADVLAVAAKLKEMALAGDLKAMQMFLKLTVGDAPKAPPAPASNGSAALAAAIEDLVDEIRITKAENAGRLNDPLLKRSAAAIANMTEDDDDE